MPTALDILFQAAEVLRPPQHYSIQIRVTVNLVPAGHPLQDGEKWQGTLQYTRRKEVRTKKEIIFEPAFFSGSTEMSSGSGSPLNLTISEPRFGIAIATNYAVDFSIQSSPPLSGGFVPESSNNDPNAYYCLISVDSIPNYPSSPGMAIEVLAPPMIMMI
jgi:hypothetical protein